MSRRFGLVWLLVALAGMLAACSNTGTATPGAVANSTPSASLTSANPGVQPVTVVGTTVQSSPDCPKMSAGQPLPSLLPKNFPLPGGTAFTSQETRSENRLILNGIIPASLADTKAFLEKELVKAGYKVEGGDSESGEAEADYNGNGVKGRWLIRGNAACPGITIISLLVQAA